MDEILGGGLETSSVTEVYGEWRTGKTQLGLTMCVTAQINEQRPGKAIFIDTEGNFRPERLEAIAARFGLEAASVQENVMVARAHTTDVQMDMLTEAAAFMAEQPCTLLVVDSIAANYRTEFVGRGELAERQQKLGQFMRRLKKLAEEFNCAVLVTNQVLSDPSGEWRRRQHNTRLCCARTRRNHVARSPAPHPRHSPRRRVAVGDRWGHVCG